MHRGTVAGVGSEYKEDKSLNFRQNIYKPKFQMSNQIQSSNVKFWILDFDIDLTFEIWILTFFLNKIRR